MKIILRDNTIPEFRNGLSEAYFSGMNIGVFDIETLGLSPIKNPMILSGFCYFNKDDANLQYASPSVESFECRQISIDDILDNATEKDRKIISKSDVQNIKIKETDYYSPHQKKEYQKYEAERKTSTGEGISGDNQNLSQDENQCTCIQYFAEGLYEERRILEKTVDTLKKLDVIVTFNGVRFDIPYVKKRAEIFDIPFDNIPYHLDLYQVIRNYSDIRNFLPNLKQKTVEKFMGLFSRTDEISGKESINLYYDYLDNGDPELKREILLHNSDDVFQLYRLMDIIKKTDFHKAMNELGFPVKGKNYYVEIREANVVNNKFTVKGISHLPVSERIYFGETLNYRIKPNKTFEISMDLVPFRNYLIADLRNFDCSNSLIKDLPGYSNEYLVVDESNNPKPKVSIFGNKEFDSAVRMASTFSNKSKKESRSLKLPEANMLAKLLTERIFQNGI